MRECAFGVVQAAAVIGGRMAETLLDRLKSTQAILALVFGIVAVILNSVQGLKTAFAPVLPAIVIRYLPAALIVLALLAILHAMLLAKPRRSRLIRPEALRLQRDNPGHLVGREEEIERILDKARLGPLLFVEGESGVGKSALLGVGVMREAAEDGAMLPVYVASLAGPDWEGDAWRLLFAAVHKALDAEQRNKLKINGLPAGPARTATLRALQKATGRMPLLILDQFDDYQSKHWERFHTYGSWTKAADVVAANGFWRALSELLADGAMHLVVVTRSDRAGGLESVRFIAPENFTVPRLEKHVILGLLNTIAADGAPAIENPEAGWAELRDRLADDLGASGAVLPQQLKIALLGLATLPRQILSVAAYDRAGKVAGLEAAWIAGRVTQAVRACGLEEAQVRHILLALVDPDDPRKTRDLSVAEIVAVADLAAGDGRKVEAALTPLEQDEVVRRRRDPGDKEDRWRLDHDYLAGVVREADRRANAWVTRLKEGEAGLEAAGRQPLRKWQALLGLNEQAGLVANRLRGRFRYGAYRGYAALSLLRLAPAALVLAAGVGLYAYEARQNAVRTSRDQIVGAFDTDEEVSEQEARQILRLASADEATQRAVLEQFLSSSARIASFSKHLSPIARALRWRSDAASASWGADILVAAIERNADSAEGMSLLAQALGELSDRLPAERAEAEAKALVAAIERNADAVMAQAALGAALAELGDRLPPAQAQAAVKALVAAMDGNADNIGAVITLARALHALGGHLTAAQVQDAAKGLVAAMDKASDVSSVSLMADALGGLGERLPPAQAQPAAQKLIAAINGSAESASMIFVSRAIGKMGASLPQAESEAAAQALTAAMQRKANDADSVSMIGNALGSLGERLPRPQAEAAAKTMIAAMRREQDNIDLMASIGRALGTFGDRLPAAEADTAVTMLTAAVDRNPGRNAGALVGQWRSGQIERADDRAAGRGDGTGAGRDDRAQSRRRQCCGLGRRHPGRVGRSTAAGAGCRGSGDAVRDGGTQAR